MKISELVFEAKATKTRLDKKCWKGKKIGTPKTKVKGGVRVNNCVPKESWNRSMHKDVELGDVFFLELGGLLIESTVIGTSADSIIIEGDDITIKLLEKHRQLVESIQVDEVITKKTPAGEIIKDFQKSKNAKFKGKSKEERKRMALGAYYGMHPEKKKKANEAKYQGREVPLGKPMAGDVKKSKVYVKKPNGKVVKVNFGDKKMRIKKSNPKRRKSFRARHNCSNPGPRWKARYWSCRMW